MGISVPPGDFVCHFVITMATSANIRLSFDILPIILVNILSILSPIFIKIESVLLEI